MFDVYVYVYMSDQYSAVAVSDRDVFLDWIKMVIIIVVIASLPSAVFWFEWN